jgi:replicative DNA helicase
MSDGLERQYLSALLSEKDIDPSCLLSVDDMESSVGREAIGAYLNLRGRRLPHDTFAVARELERLGRPGAVAELIEATSKVCLLPLERVAEQLRTTNRCRKAREWLALASEAASRGEVGKVQELALKGIRETSALQSVGVSSLGEAAQSAIQDYAILDSSRPSKLVPIGIRRVDKFVGGIDPATLTTIIARTGVGKSKLVLSCAISVAKQGYPAGIITLEDPLGVYGCRFLGLRSGVEPRRMRTRELSTQERQALHSANQGNKDLKVFVADCVGQDISRAISAMYSLARAGCRVIYLDYLQKLSVDYKTIREILQQLQLHAKMLDVAMVMVSQTARPARDRDGKLVDQAPSLYEAKGSGEIENESRLAVVIFKEEGSVCGKVVKSTFGGEDTFFRFAEDPRSKMLVEVE